MKLILLGAPGAGKGTQAEFISKKYDIPTISTGAMLREAVKNGTEIGLKAKAFMESGGLVPDEVIIGIVAERIQAPDCVNGFILDGVPRTIAQAEAIEASGIELDAAVSLEIDDSEIEERIVGRRSCKECGAGYHVKFSPTKVEGVCDVCGGELIQRADDTVETVRERLRVYHESTEPLKAFYEARGKLKKVEGSGDIAEITQLIFKALETV